MSKKISKDKPLQELILRKYEKPSPNHDIRTLSRFFLLSIGLLQPGDSRDIIVDVFCVLYLSKNPLTAVEIEEQTKAFRLKYKEDIIGSTSSNIRRQILRLRESSIIEKNNTYYRLTESLSLKEIFSEIIEKFMLNSILKRINLYIDELEIKKEYYQKSNLTST